MVRIKKICKKVWGWLKTPYTIYKEKKELNKRIEELRKKDPFIYK
jgi:hypothetical protein